MELVWQTTSNTKFLYLWCHGCEQPLEGGLSITGGPPRVEGAPSPFWLRLCPSCIDKINSYLREELVNELAS